MFIRYSVSCGVRSLRSVDTLTFPQSGFIYQEPPFPCQLLYLLPEILKKKRKAFQSLLIKDTV